MKDLKEKRAAFCAASTPIALRRARYDGNAFPTGKLCAWNSHGSRWIRILGSRLFDKRRVSHQHRLDVEAGHAGRPQQTRHNRQGKIKSSNLLLRTMLATADKHPIRPFLTSATMSAFRSRGNQTPIRVP
jgi:hypothetical protein